MRNEVFSVGAKTIIGMVHLAPMPGTPFYEVGSLSNITGKAVRDVQALQDGGADGCLVQTVDRTYAVGTAIDPARISAFALVVDQIVRSVRPGFHVGVQIMPNEIEASIGVAKVAGASFVRATAFVGPTNTQWGGFYGNPHKTVAYRKSIAAEDVFILADVSTQHFSWSSLPCPPIGSIARWVREAGAAAVCLGHPDPEIATDLARLVRHADAQLPIVLCGHTNHSNVVDMMKHASGALVGSCLQAGKWSGPIELELVRTYVKLVREAYP